MVRQHYGTIALALLGALAPHSGTGAELKWDTFAQLTAESTDSDDAIRFGAEAVRVGLALREGAWSGRLVLDLNAGDLDERPPGTLANVIKDVYASYAFDQRHSLRFGQFKVPLGMDFMLPGSGLDLTKRGMEKGLVLERDLGVLFSASGLPNGLGYAIGVFNPAGRSAATRHVGSGPADQSGDDLAFAARATFDPDPHWHAEIALGTSQNAGGPDTQDYRVADFGLRWQEAPWTLKAEYIAGSDVRGTEGRDEQVWYAHAEYALSPSVSALLRHYSGTSELDATETGLDNTFVGLTVHFDRQRRSNNRLMINYVFAGGDRSAYTGVRGFREDALYLQYQFHYVQE